MREDRVQLGGNSSTIEEISIASHKNLTRFTPSGYRPSKSEQPVSFN